MTFGGWVGEYVYVYTFIYTYYLPYNCSIYGIITNKLFCHVLSSIFCVLSNHSLCINGVVFLLLFSACVNPATKRSRIFGAGDREQGGAWERGGAREQGGASECIRMHAYVFICIRHASVCTSFTPPSTNVLHIALGKNKTTNGQIAKLELRSLAQHMSEWNPT